jgi:hypothetical protein
LRAISAPDVQAPLVRKLRDPQPRSFSTSVFTSNSIGRLSVSRSRRAARSDEFAFVNNITSWYPGQFALLAPSETHVPRAFRRIDVDPDRHEQILAQLQRLRGRVYLHDGAIESSQLSPDGRHRLPVDEHSWHVVSLDHEGDVVGCARYHPHSDRVRLEDLGVWSSALARHHEWQPVLREAVEEEIELARRRNLAYAEVGGWAVAQDLRFTPQAVDIALSTYALAQKLGGCVGITTATVRNFSSRILRKIGGRPLKVATRTLPSYYDPQYRCDMELLRFESSAPNPKYQARMARVAARLPDLPVVCARGGPLQRLCSDRTLTADGRSSWPAAWQVATWQQQPQPQES